MNNTKRKTDLDINGNMDGNIIVGDGNQITVSSNLGVDKTASEMAIQRLEKEIKAIKNADNEIIEIKARHYLPKNLGVFPRGLAHVLINEYQGQPSELLKKWNGTGFKDKELNSVLTKLTIKEIQILIVFFSTIYDDYPKTPTYYMKYEVKEVLEDLDRLKELEESKILLPQKLEELQKHKKIVQVV